MTPLTPLRAAGLVAALIFAVAALVSYRRGRLGNGDLLLRLLVFVLPLLVVSLEPASFNWVLDQFSFRAGGGRRILGAAVIAVGILYAFSWLIAAREERTRRDLTRLIENLALEQFRSTADLDQFTNAVAIVIPAYNEAENINAVLATLPDDVSGLAHGADRRRRRLGRRHGRACPGGGRGRGAAPAQPRPGRGAPLRLPTRARHRRARRRDDGRRRTAPGERAPAPGRPDPRGEGRRRPRLAGARRRRPDASDAQGRHHRLLLAPVGADLEPHHRSVVRLPGHPHRGAEGRWSSTRTSSTRPSS